MRTSPAGASRRIRQLREQTRHRTLDVLATAGLAVALAGAGLLTVETYRADAARRQATVQGVRHLAALAAVQFARDVSAEVGHLLRMALWFGDSGPGSAVNHGLHAAAHCEQCAPGPAAGAKFALRERSGKLVFEGAVPLDVGTRQLQDVADRVAARLGRGDGPSNMIGTVRAADGRLLGFAAEVTRTSAGMTVQGFLARPGWLEATLRDVAARGTLLPVLLGPGFPTDSALAFVVTEGTGVPVFQAGSPVLSGIAGTAPLILGDSLLVEVRLAPAALAALSDLVPRAPPALPLLVFVLTAIVLVMAAIYQRRSAALARSRTGFLSSVSHDLNTPLALITVYAETLLNPGAVSITQRDQFVEVILREARRLSRLVANALRFVEIGEEPARLTAGRVDLRVLLRETVMDLSPFAAMRGASLAFGPEPRFPVLVEADRDAIRQVLFNLLDNALKYGPAGQCVRIGLTVAERHVAVTVDDEGPGIPRHDRQRVFGRYTRLHDIENGVPAGSGIGLAVVRDLCEKMAILVELGDAPVGGTRVTLTLRRTAPRAPDVGGALAADHASASAG